MREKNKQTKKTNPNNPYSENLTVEQKEQPFSGQ